MSDEFFGFGAIPKDLAAKILADEMGLEFGVHGDFCLYCTIEPIFRHEDGRLTPVTANAFLVLYLNGQPMAVAELLPEVTAEDRAIVGRVCEVLTLPNVHNMGVEGIALYVQTLTSMASEWSRGSGLYGSASCG